MPYVDLWAKFWGNYLPHCDISWGSTLNVWYNSRLISDMSRKIKTDWGNIFTNVLDKETIQSVSTICSDGPKVNVSVDEKSW